MSEQQPAVQWAPIPPKPRNRGRVWLVVGLSVAALIIVGVLLFFLIPREDEQPVGRPTPTASSSATQTPTLIPSPSSDPTAPAETPPPVADPTVETFRGEVQVWLDNSLIGLDIVGDTSGQEALSVIETLLADAQRLGERAAPSSIEGDWYAGVSSYVEELGALKSAAAERANTDSAAESARVAAQTLRKLVGL